MWPGAHYIQNDAIPQILCGKHLLQFRYLLEDTHWSKEPGLNLLTYYNAMIMDMKP